MSAFPAALLPLVALPRWVLWRWTLKKDARGQPLDQNDLASYDKPPLRIDGFPASTSNDAHLSTYADATAAWTAAGVGAFHGVGFAPRFVDGLLFLDLDDCRDPATGTVTEWAQGIVAACASYTEVSPSGRGLRIVGTPGSYAGRPTKSNYMLPGGGAGEIYRGSNYVTITFNRLAGTPDALTDIGAAANAVLERSTVGAALGAGPAAGAVRVEPLAPIEVVAEALALIPNEQNSWHWWKERIGMAVFAATEGSQEGFEAWDTWSRKCPTYGLGKTCEEEWERMRASPPDRAGYGTLNFEAKQAEAAAGRAWSGGDAWRAWKARTAFGKAGSVGAAVVGDPLNDAAPVASRGGLPAVAGLSSSDPKPEGADFPKPLPAHSDSMLAERVIHQQDGCMRYVAERGQWLMWRGSLWQRDATLEVVRRVESVCRDVAQTSNLQLASSILSAKTIRAVETLARSNSRAASTTSEWDSDPWLLNTPGGTIDLRTGMLRASCREDLSTRQTTVTPDFKAECPLWRSFLHTITGGDGDLESYIARVAGYCLTGITSEHALFFLHGTGRNGKGTFSHTLRKMLGSYAVAAESQTFAASQGSQHTTELARLDGARLVVTSETEEGKAWNESRIKQLTGGDPVTARFMRQDNFTFMPRFKLVMLGNHKPRLKTVDEAMRARINMLPFTVFVPPGERQKDLDDKMLAAEGGAILAWAVRGCMAWQIGGLQPPAAVLSATDAYVEAEDSRTAWFNEACRDLRDAPDGLKHETRLAELFASWRMWAEKANEFAGSQKAADEWITQRGFAHSTNPMNQKVFRGLRLLTAGLTSINETVVSSSGFAAPVGAGSVVRFPGGDKPKA